MKVRSVFAGAGCVLASFLSISSPLGGESESDNAPTKQRSPLKVFVLVGQSNMQGQGYVDETTEDGSGFLNGTLEWMVETYPETYGKLKTEDGDGWKRRDDVRVAYNRQGSRQVRPSMNVVGPLTVGYGGKEGKKGDRMMGPELGFGWTVGDELLESRGEADDEADDDAAGVLLIKIAWGGLSLAVDFRPPSSKHPEETGLYYEAMLANVYRTLSRLPEVVPGYTRDRGYSLEGFAWHQGWADGCKKDMTDEYETNLVNLIRDVRVDLGVPDLPFVIGVSGILGWEITREYESRVEIIEAQLAVADASRYPGFAGTVAAVETRDFHRETWPASPGKQTYHWNNNCESYWLVGRAMGEAMVELVRRRRENENEKESPFVTLRANHIGQNDD